MFANYSRGVATSRDTWCFNHARTAVESNIKRSIEFYNSEVARFQAAAKKNPKLEAKDFVDRDSSRISWDHAELQGVERGRALEFDAASVVRALYRPFDRQWLYFNRRFNNRVYQMLRIFPDATAKNVVIGVSASETRSAYSVLITDQVASLHAVDMVGSQFFPLYLYDDEPEDETDVPLFAASNKQSGPKRRDAIADEGLAHFRDAYPGETISKEDLFYYVYGLLHSPDYRERFADNLGKELPRIPRVKTAADFWAFSKAGRELGDLHINYEKAPIYEGAKVTHAGNARNYRVEKMRYGGKGRGADQDRTTLLYNDTITVTGIPLDAYAYVVNGKPALDWVVERQCVKTDKDSGIVNDANDWAIETMKNPKYPLELFLRVITVSLETMKIVKALPKLDIHEKG